MGREEGEEVVGGRSERGFGKDGEGGREGGKRGRKSLREQSIRRSKKGKLKMEARGGREGKGAGGARRLSPLRLY